ncbi:MAG: hypothetical protein A3F67_10710 [Verrucomicrobia bacterium RIFCSPHIGHO2_12_FULL_41_10]|nr:MAG: hypothetical protein A3F67_10710 [Verrucomicrobia bacterium RIFCSPHIGHO2_12_FULL_41_10]
MKKRQKNSQKTLIHSFLAGHAMKRLGINTFDYIYDRMSRKYEMTSLADLIHQRSMILTTS